MMRVGPAFLLLACVAAAEDDRVAIRVKDKALQQQIHGAIDRGVAYLKSIQNPAGSWGRGATEKELKKQADLSHTGGYTALALYALAASGVPKDDPAIVRGLRWTEQYKRAYLPNTVAATYANSLLVLALTRIDAKEHRDRIHRIAQRIERGERSSGFWTYALGGGSVSAKRDLTNPDRREFNKGTPLAGRPDNSNTQFAVLALWAAQSLAGYPVKKKTWQKIWKHFRKGQTQNGGWGYENKRDRRATATMTAAGIVSAVYALVAIDGRKEAEALARRHVAPVRGVAALKRLMKGWDRPGGMKVSRWGNYYLIYSLERVGTVMKLDPEEWYVEGARYLVDQQSDDGAWPRDVKRRPMYYETSLALLFLVRATYPPIKGAVTRREKPRAKAAVTSKEKFPDVTKAKGLARAFFQYKDFKPDQRAAILLEFGKAGPAAVGYFIEKLKDKRESVRRAALELLEKLLAKRILFDAKADAEERAIMLAPIEAFYRERGKTLRWDADRNQFVLP